ncbi:MAG: hypothetical protein M0R46_11780 [Candidatus Muirbacterium halophilum]|nr:hypothetical protein [Candidatus Muirbacterium halophilum]MCK9476594.1 hypothetical protein [Candidatus Muirbacterium halophilum]
MKIYILSLFILFTNIITFSQIPLVYSDYISDLSKKTEYKKIYPATNFIPNFTENKIPEQITYAQALEDLLHFSYLLENAYAGFDYFEKKGVNFKEKINNLKSDFSVKSSNLKVNELEKHLAGIMKGINDGNFAIIGNKNWKFYKRKNSYLSEILIEKFYDNSYIVVNSAVDNVPIGSKYIGSENNLFKTLSPTGKKHYLIGKLSENLEGFMDVDFIINEKKWNISIPLHSNWSGEYYNQNTKNSFFKTNNINGIRLRNFTIMDKNYNTLKKSAKSWADSMIFDDNIIIDLFNAKGSEGIIEEFTQALNGTWADPQYIAYLYSPATVQANNVTSDKYIPYISDYLNKFKKQYEKMIKEPTREFKLDFRLPRTRKDFSGKVIALANRNTVSGAEDALMIVKESFKDVIVVGENTAGLVNFGEVRYYQLPLSKIWIAIPSVLFISDYKEGEGVLPDLWLDCPDPVGEVAKWISDPDNYVYNFSCALPDSEKKLINNYMSDFIEFLFSPNQKSMLDNLEYLRTNSFDTENDIKFKGTATISIFSKKNSQITGIDPFIKKSGRGSLKFKNSDYTDVFELALWKIPDNMDNISINYSVKANKLETSSYNNSYGAFLAIIGQDKDGNIIFEKKDYKGTFDWKDDNLTINLKEKNIIKAIFITGNFLSGTIYIDELKLNMLSVK